MNGESVKASQPVGVEGNTGDSGGTHLHFTVKKDGTSVDPAQFFNVDLTSKQGVIPTGDVYKGGVGAGAGINGKKTNAIKLTKEAWRYYASYATKPVEALKDTTGGGSSGSGSNSGTGDSTGGTTKNPEAGSTDWPNKGTDKFVDYKGKKILIVNKNYGLSDDTINNYVDSSEGQEANQKFAEMKSAGSIGDATRYRDYSTQEGLYSNEIEKTGVPEAYYWTAKPGYSEHHTGLAWDISGFVTDYGSGQDAQSRELAKDTTLVWIAEHAHEYGFIIRFPDNKKEVTGYGYEPWHVRYVGVELATELKNNGQTLEEFFASQL